MFHFVELRASIIVIRLFVRPRAFEHLLSPLKMAFVNQQMTLRPAVRPGIVAYCYFVDGFRNTTADFPTYVNQVLVNSLPW